MTEPPELKKMKETKQQFAFGDIVRHKETGALFAVSDLGEDEGYIAAMCKENGIVWNIEKDMLEIIPHPDTVRLDWLADPGNRIGNVMLPAECVEQNPDSMRAAIDMAMRLDGEQQAGAQNE